MLASPEIDLHTRCARCGHTLSFHGRQIGGPCKAMGCKGEQGHRCTAYSMPDPVEPAATPLKG